MIRHVVMWKLKEKAEGLDKPALGAKIKEMLEALVGVVPDIAHLEVGLDTSGTADSYDVVLISDFADQAALDRYQEHPEHKKAGGFIGKVRLERKVVDYEV